MVIPGRMFKPLIAFAFFIALCGVSMAQTVEPSEPVTVPTTAPSPTPKADTTNISNSMDVFDLVKLVFKRKNAKPRVKKRQNLNGPFITTIPYPGYTIATGIAAVVPINIAFYINKKDHGNLSFFNNNFQYTQYKQMLALSLSDLYFGHDKWQLIGDWRFYNFPTNTYGLGSLTKLSDADKINYLHLRVYEMITREVAQDFSVGLGYHLDYHWNIRDLNAEDGKSTDFQRYGFTKQSRSSALSLNLIYDTRDNPNNPYDGLYFNSQFRSNLKGLGGSSNWNSLILDVRKYFPLSKKWRMELACWAYVWLTLNGKPPYLDLPSTGWDTYNNTGRGYGMGRFRGKHFLYFESEFRFNIMRNGLIGGVAFVNLQTVSQYPSNNFNSVQPGGGIGLRIKLNKRTNTNSAVDYGFGSGGSRGFAFNFNEVF